MPYTYVTFGQAHTHVVNGKLLNRDCVARIPCTGATDGRRLAFAVFGPKFCFEYHEDEFDATQQMMYFPDGVVDLTEEDIDAVLEEQSL